MSDNREVQRVLTVFCNETEELVAEHQFASFDIMAFKQHFGIEDDYDPQMYHVYSVTSDDVAFVSQFLSEPIAFNFDENAYFVEAQTA